MFTTLYPLVLASSSPRRHQFFRDLGLVFRIVLPQGNEPRPERGEPPAQYALRTASEKGEGVTKQCPDSVVLAADTIVVLGKSILGKPENEKEALAMLKQLSGRTHSVITAVSVHIPGAEHQAFYCKSAVTFHAWHHDVLEAYARSGESLDKAGGYAVQGLGSFLIQSIKGSWTNVVGLPVTKVTELLLKQGVLQTQAQ